MVDRDAWNSSATWVPAAAFSVRLKASVPAARSGPPPPFLLLSQGCGLVPPLQLPNAARRGLTVNAVSATVTGVR